MTTERKIEIAEGVLMQTSQLEYQGMCTLMCNVVDSIDEALQAKRYMYDYYKIIGGKEEMGWYWFTNIMPKGKNERIEFLEKYIEHLKA